MIGEYLTAGGPPPSGRYAPIAQLKFAISGFRMRLRAHHRYHLDSPGWYLLIELGKTNLKIWVVRKSRGSPKVTFWQSPFEMIGDPEHAAATRIIHAALEDVMGKKIRARYIKNE